MGNTLMNLTKIWDAFFFPVLDTVVAWYFFLMLLGRKRILRIWNHICYKKDGQYCRKAYQLDEDGNLVKTYKPINDSLLELAGKPLSLILIALLACLAFYRIIMALSYMFPIHVSYQPSTILLQSYSERFLAEVWSKYPNLDLESLISKLQFNRVQAATSYAYGAEFMLNLDSVVKFCGSVSFVLLTITSFYSIFIVALLIMAYLLHGGLCVVRFLLKKTGSFLKRYVKKVPFLRSNHGQRKANSSRVKADTSTNHTGEFATSFSDIEHILFNRFISSVLFSVRALFMFLISMCIFLVCCLYQFKHTQGELVSSFERERIIETSGHESSEETINDFLSKVEEEKGFIRHDRHNEYETYETENVSDSYNFFRLLYWREGIGVYLSFFGWYIEIPKPSEIILIGEVSPTIREFIHEADDFITGARYSLY